MASIKARKLKDGGYSYKVEWVIGGKRGQAGAVWGSETFAHRVGSEHGGVGALEFKEMVEAAGGHWPTCPKTGVKWIKGKGFVSPAQTEGPVSFQTVAEAYFIWDRAEAVDALKSKSAKQWERDKATYERELLPRFGARPFAEIEAAEIAAWRNDHLGGRIRGQKKVSAKTFRNHHAVLSAIMKHGSIRMRLRPDNPCQATTLPKVASDKEIRFFLHGEWKIFRAGMHPSSLLFIDVDLATGMRWGEIAALRKKDCSALEVIEGEDTVHIHIERAWKERGKTEESPIRWDEAENQTWMLGPPKNGRARWTSVTGELARRLDAAIADLEPEDYVFVTAYGNPWRYPDFHTDRWVPATEKAAARGVAKHLVPHMMRHTFVVWSIAEGERIEKISEKIGHASLAFTFDKYGGILDFKDASTARAMARQMLIADQAIVPQPAAVAAVAEQQQQPKAVTTPTRIARRQAGRERLARSRAS